MNVLKKFWIVFVSFLPFSAGALAPLAIVGLGGLGVIAGFSIYRSFVPVNMTDALNFFSTCWTCQMFSDVMASMSNMIPGLYSGMGKTILTFAIGLVALWVAWYVASGFFNAKIDNPWSLSAQFINKLVKLGVVCALLMIPLPRLLSDVVIEPIFNIGLSLNHIVSGENDFNMCIVATAVADPASISPESASRGAFSPKLRHNLTCQVASVHQLTGLGMTIGWTMLNMAFNDEYMHKIMWNIPIFPNVPVFFMGLLIIVLFFFALLPIPLYFLKMFITLCLDLIMLPIMLLSWLFSDWSIFPNGGRNIRGMIDDVIKSTAGIAMVGVFLTFAIMFLNAIFGDWDGASVLQTAIVQNDSSVLMDALMLRNDSLITIILMGIFIAMFMNAIPALVETLFANVHIPKEAYEDTKKNLNTLWKGLKKASQVIKK